MKRWEYEIVNSNSYRRINEKSLNAWGEEGWELVSVNRYVANGFSTDDYVFCFKRLLDDDSDF